MKKEVKKQVRKWTRRAGIWLYLRYHATKKHIDRMTRERSHDVVHIRSAHIRLFSNLHKTITLTMDMTANFISNYKRRGMYMRSPHDPQVDGVFLKWAPQNTIPCGLGPFLDKNNICPAQYSIWLKIEYSYKGQEEEDESSEKYAAVYMIVPEQPYTRDQPYYYFPPYSITTVQSGNGNYFTGPAIPSTGTISAFHRWPETWMRAEIQCIEDCGKKTS